MINLRCQKCGQTWGYNGTEAQIYSCPRCFMEEDYVPDTDRNPDHVEKTRNWKPAIIAVMGVIITVGLSVLSWYLYNHDYSKWYLVASVVGVVTAPVLFIGILYLTRTKPVLRQDDPFLSISEATLTKASENPYEAHYTKGSHKDTIRKLRAEIDQLEREME